MGPHDALHAGGTLRFLLDSRRWWGGFANTLAESLSLGLVVFATVCLLRRLIRWDLLAAVVTAVIFAATEGVFNQRGIDLWIELGLMTAVYTILAYVLMRIGLVATIALVFFVNVCNALWLGGDWKAWYASTGIATLILALAIVTFAFWRSLGGRELIGSPEET
jgi:hypothetical protein